MLSHKGLRGWKKLRSTNVKKFSETDSRTFKVALLGSSGTDTKEIATSLRSLYSKKNTGNDQDEDNDEVDHAAYKNLVRYNAYQSLRNVVVDVNSYEVESPNPDTLKSVSKITLHKHEKINDEIPREIWTCFRRLWNDSDFKNFAEKTTEPNRFKEAEYYFQSIDRISAGTFEPSAHDVALCRVKLNGIVKSPLRKNLWLFEVAQITSIHTALRVLQFFDNKTVIIFCVDLLLYNQFEDDGKTNKLSRAMDQYQEVAKNKNTADSLILLLFTKIDQLESSLKQHNLKSYFPDFKGKSTLQDARDFIKEMFNRQKQKNCMLSLFISGNGLNFLEDRNRVKNAINECAVTFQRREIQF